MPAVPTVFTRIIDGDLPGTFVWRDPECVAFLSINPIQPGHTLVVPRAEVDHWLDLEPRLARRLMTVSQVVGKAIERAFSPPRSGCSSPASRCRTRTCTCCPIPASRTCTSTAAHGASTPPELAANGERLRAALRDLGAAEVSE